MTPVSRTEGGHRNPNPHQACTAVDLPRSRVQTVTVADVGSSIHHQCASCKNLKSQYGLEYRRTSPLTSVDSSNELTTEQHAVVKVNLERASVDDGSSIPHQLASFDGHRRQPGKCLRSRQGHFAFYYIKPTTFFLSRNNLLCSTTASQSFIHILSSLQSVFPVFIISGKKEQGKQGKKEEKPPATMFYSSLLVVLFAVVSLRATALTPGPEFIRLNKNDSVVLSLSLSEYTS